MSSKTTPATPSDGSWGARADAIGAEIVRLADDETLHEAAARVAAEAARFAAEGYLP